MTAPVQGRGRGPGFWVRGGEEGVLERTAKTYFLSLIAAAIAALGVAMWWFDVSFEWWLGALLISAALAVIARQYGGDAVLALWWRWPVVAKDCGLIANESGVPDLLGTKATKQSCTATISALAVPTMDAIEMEDRIADGFGYSAGVITEVRGRVRRSRKRWELTMYRDDVMASTIPVQFHNCVDVNTDPVFLGMDKMIHPGVSGELRL